MIEIHSRQMHHGIFHFKNLAAFQYERVKTTFARLEATMKDEFPARRTAPFR